MGIVSAMRHSMCSAHWPMTLPLTDSASSGVRCASAYLSTSLPWRVPTSVSASFMPSSSGTETVKLSAFCSSS